MLFAAGCRRCRCRRCPRPLGAERSGGGRRVSPAGEAGARRGASQRPPREVCAWEEAEEIPAPLLALYLEQLPRSAASRALPPSLLPRRRDLQASTREFSNKSRRCAPRPAGFVWNRRSKNKQCVLGLSHARDECTTRGQARDVGAPRPGRSCLGVRDKSRTACTVVPPRESLRVNASLSRLLYLEQGSFRLRDLASGTGPAATGSRQVLPVVGEL